MNPPLDINLQSKMPLKDFQPWCSKILVPQTHSAPSFSHLILLSPPGPRIPSSKMPRLVLMLQPIFPFPPSNFIFFPFFFSFFFPHISVLYDSKISHEATVLLRCSPLQPISSISPISMFHLFLPALKSSQTPFHQNFQSSTHLSPLRF